MLRTDANQAFLPEDTGALVVQPVLDQAIATQVATLASTTLTTFRIPVVSEDPTAAWTAEGAPITPTDGTLDEEVVTPDKLAGLTVISNELANDSSPAAAGIVGQGLARDIARRLDEAFFGDTVANGPDGLESLEDVNDVDAGDDWSDCDPFNEAIFAAEAEGARLHGVHRQPRGCARAGTAEGRDHEQS